MNGQPALPEVLEGAWWGCVPTPAPAAPQRTRLISWWPFGGSHSTAPPPVSERGQNGLKPRVGRPRSISANLDSAGKARRVSTGAKPQPAGGAGAPTQPAPGTSDAQAAAAVTAPATEGSAATKKPQGSRQAKAEGGIPRPASKPNLSKQLSYQERRQLWRERLEHAKAKAEKRAATSAAIAAATEGGSLGGGSQQGGAGRKFVSRHIAIPASKLGSGSSGSQTTPVGSPRRNGPLHGEHGSEAGSKPGSNGPGGSSPPPEFMDVPPIWQGFQTAEAPADFSACNEQQLRRFLAQAGRTSPPPQTCCADLAAAARDCRGAWEVERIMVACQWPQEVLRVPRYADPATLKAAYRRVSVQVHPDKNTAGGASDAFSIVADAYSLLTLGKAAAAIPAFMRQNHPTRMGQQHSSAAGPMGGVGGPSAAEGDQNPGQQQPAQRPTAQPESSAGFTSEGSAHGSTHGSVHGEEQLSRVSSVSFAEHYFAPARHTSSAEEEGPGTDGVEQVAMPSHHVGGSDGHDHWNPHGQLSSNEELSPQLTAATGFLERPPSRDSLSSAGAEGLAAVAAAGDWADTGEEQTPRTSPLASQGCTTHGGGLGPICGGILPGASQREQPSPQSTGLSGAAGSSTPDFSRRPTPTHSRSSSTHSFAGDAAPAGPSTAAGRGAGIGGTAASHPGSGAAGGKARAAAPLEKPLNAATKIRVTVKYKPIAGKK